MSTLANELRSRLTQYLNVQCSLEEFEAWFSPILRDVHKSSDGEAEYLVQEIEWAFCDLECGASIKAVADRLRQLIP